MLVSIVITNYNYAAYLAPAIDSALNQTYADVEVIVIDDGSSDNSAEIISRYAGRVIPVLKQNSGHCACINLGFAMSRGAVVIFLDADDVLFDFAVAAHVANLRRPGVVKSCGYLEVVDAEGRSIGSRIPRKLSPSGDYRELTLRKGIGAYCASYTSGNAWARYFLDKVMPLPDTEAIHNRVGPDGFLASVDVLFGRIESIHCPIGQYRVHGKNNGPINFRFDAVFMRMRLQCRYHRIEYVKQVASKMGLRVDLKEFSKIADWRLNLMRHVPALIEKSGVSPAFFEFICLPFRHCQGQWGKTLLLSMLFLVIRILPRSLALGLAHYLLVKRVDLNGTAGGVASDLNLRG